MRIEALRSGRHYYLLGDVDAWAGPLRAEEPRLLVVAGRPDGVARAVARSLAASAGAVFLDAPAGCDPRPVAWALHRASRTGGRVLAYGPGALSASAEAVFGVPWPPPLVAVDPDGTLNRKFVDAAPPRERSIRIRAWASGKAAK